LTGDRASLGQRFTHRAMPDTLSPVGKRFDHIDGLRGIAALLVVLLHAWGVADQAGATYSWLLYFDIGRIGVVAFFCISGFLIPFTIDGLQTFAIRRASRILPAYWLSIPITMFAFWFGYAKTFDFHTIVLNVIILPRFLGDTSISGVYWTLEIEVLFYALCAVLFAFGLIRNATWLLAISASGTAAFFLPFALVPHALAKLDPEHFGFMRLTFFYIGLMTLAAVFRLWCEGNLSKWQTRGMMTLGALFVLVFPLLAGAIVRIQPYLATSFGILLFLASFAAARAFAIAVPLGRISYSLYLFHPVTFLLFPTLGPLLVVPLTTLVSVAVAIVVYFAIEKPGIAFGHSITRLRRSAA
jgi:peptidoglycan/LPS O-acetylase OafA/YrhL